MSDGTPIGWTDATWNMIRAAGDVGKRLGWICVRVSAGCVNCYAADLNGRLGNGEDYTVPGLARVTPYLDEKALEIPLHWRKPRRVFVCSMTDLFGEWVPDEWIWQVYGVMSAAPHHTFQILTKRPERMRRIVSEITGRKTPCPNVHLGVSVEDRETYTRRVLYLANTPAAVRFVSMEPLLADLGDLMLDGIYGGAYQWAIIGAESGRNRRPFDLAWLESVVIQCDAAKVPVYVKQDSAFKPGQQGRIPDRLWRHEFPSLSSRSEARQTGPKGAR